ncbi:unnamed protein product [Ilex paraguariensis]|uniref:Bifunctional inhibitor/plant lipid transfer protein/seed storage helical domain-containing protein n=1 Tax=Ilex paraguariensis TaxID=185542 RepID=A0ABC8SE62_9AQUA
MQACSLQGIGIELAQCLNQGKNSIPFESCCKALNQAVQAGVYCLCLLLASTSPLLSSKLSLQFSTCYISIPPLTQCLDPFPELHPPASPEPVLLPPDTPLKPPELPMTVPLPPDIVKEPPQPSDPNNLLVPSPPGTVHIPSNSSTPDNSSTIAALQAPLGSNAATNLSISSSWNSTSHGGDKTYRMLYPKLLLAVTLYAFIS